MPRTDVTPLQLVAGAGVDAAAAPVTIDATLVTNGVRLVGAGAKKGTILLRVANTAGSIKKLTIQNGGFPGAGTSDQEIPVAATSGVQLIALVDTALIEQTDESFSLDFETGFTGSILAVRVPS